MLQVTNLTKDYGSKRGAFEVNLKLSAGEIVGFIGPNGAGKSTVMNMITGLISPTQGEIVIGGQNIEGKSIQRVKDSLGILYSEPIFPPRLTPRVIFQRMARLRNLGDESWEGLAERLQVDLRRSFGTLSLGNRKKVGVVVALMHSPQLVVVDEPTSGLDPLMQKHFLQLMQEVKERKGAVLLSSHVLTEVESICDRVVMIKQGKIIQQARTKELIESFPRIFRFSLDSRVLSLVRSTGVVDQEDQLSNEIRIYTREPGVILNILSKENYSDFYLERPNLEELFMHYYE